MIFKGCNHNYKIQKEKVEKIEEDFEKKLVENERKYEFNFKYCRICNKTLDDSYTYCPYCGEKLE